jgi:hypothetical protein
MYLLNDLKVQDSWVGGVERGVKGNLNKAFQRSFLNRVV